MSDAKTVTAGDLVRDGETIAPVSGPRCRGCGKAAWRAPADEVWYLERGAAWCPECSTDPDEVPCDRK